MAWIAWGTSLVLMLGGTLAAFLADTYAPAFALLSHAILFAAIGGVLTVRVYLEEHRRLMVDAFDLGREAGGTARRFKP